MNLDMLEKRANIRSNIKAKNIFFNAPLTFSAEPNFSSLLLNEIEALAQREDYFIFLKFSSVMAS